MRGKRRRKMSFCELVSIEPSELRFPCNAFPFGSNFPNIFSVRGIFYLGWILSFSRVFLFPTGFVPEVFFPSVFGWVSFGPGEVELKKQISCSLQLTNLTDHYVAFKVKTTNPKKYCVRPNTGIILPCSTCDVVVTMQAQREAPPEMQCKDKFLIQSVITIDGATQKDVTPELFNKDAGNHVEECKLRVVYVSPPQPPSPVAEGSEEGSPPRASLSDIGNTAAFDSVLREDVDSKDKVSEELLRKQSNRAGGGFPFLYVVIVGLLGILIGYLFRRI